MIRQATQPLLPQDPARTWAYASYGAHVLSDIELPELPPDAGLPPGAPTLRITRGPVPVPNAAAAGFDFTPESARLWWPAVGAFRVAGDGLSIQCDPAPGVADALTAFPLLGPVLSESLRRRGLFVLHASAVAIGGRAVVLLADKGTGKSTAATALLRSGAQLLADDLVAVTPAGLVLPGFGQVKLSPAAAAHLPGGAVLRGPAHAAIDKHRVLIPPAAFAPGPVPVARAYVLQRGPGDGGAITPLPAAGALPALLRFAYAARFGPALLRGAAADAHFRGAVRLANTAIVRTLHPPEGLGAMDRLMPLIAADLAGDAGA